MQKILQVFVIPLILLLVAPLTAFGATASSLSQWGITWTFDKSYTYGTYANGDYWVLGPVTITGMSPAYANGRNGWEVNPKVAGSQGYDSRVYQYSGTAFDASLIPSLPYTSPSSGTVSVVKSISRTDSIIMSPLQTVAVLTIVTSIPPNNGATVFRPPYEGINKPNYLTTNMHTELLPSYARTPNAVSLSWVLNKFQHAQFEVKDPAPSLRPTDNYKSPSNGDTYGGYTAQDIVNGALGLMFDDSVSAKMPALIAYVQSGIDRYHLMLDGHRWKDGQGYNPNMKLPIYFMAAMFQDSTITASVQSLPQPWSESMELYRGVNGNVLFGDKDYWSEQSYWQNIANGGAGNYEYRDPYGYIDGSSPPDPYQVCCLSQPWKGQALAVQLMPGLKAVYDFQMLLEYADRWVTVGLWMKPDPCAPYSGSMSGYGVTFGPDGHGSCIKGSGRFPSKHGTNKDSGNYDSITANEMWTLYRNAPLATPSPSASLNPPTLLRVN